MLHTAQRYGALIESGARSWQIFQQQNGTADISLSGSWFFAEENGLETVYVKIVDEMDGHVIVPYTKCDMLPGRKWSVQLREVPAGGPYRIESCLNRGNCGLEASDVGDMVKHIGVGDLFLIAGQSNAVGYGRDYIPDPPELGVHCFGSDGEWDLAAHPLGDATNTFHPANRPRVNAAHSPYLCFAKILHHNLGYPIGLIPTALGCSSLSEWNPHENGRLFANMVKICRAAGGRVAGVLWYQGCDDTRGRQWETYVSRFRQMVEALRKELSSSKLPFFTVQLNKSVTARDEDTEGWGMVRDAQRKAAKDIPHVHIVPSMDVNVCDRIHNNASANLVIGQRLANQALHYLYGKNTLCDAPEIVSAIRLNEYEILLKFENVHQELYFRREVETEIPFALESGGGMNQVLDCEAHGDTLTVRTALPVGEHAVISCGAFIYCSNNLPFDTHSFLPILAFYRIPVQ